MRKELENRLVRFAVSVINICKSLRNDEIEKHLSNQLMRSSTSAALNYGEAQGAESKKDFIHKVSLVLKELRESSINLKIIADSDLSLSKEVLEETIKESNQLISIFYKTLQTARGRD